MRITVIVSEAEYAKIKHAAGLIPLSAYLKAAAMEKVDVGWSADGTTFKNPKPWPLLSKKKRGESALAAKNGGGAKAKVGK